ncbi:LPXTG cell wall anchor domain-containing protein [Levilactobacillus brevis]|uniref:LPXTG cell wall anchor domain-containing protein n=1 Tax=Levilactobacillus brevis TaxID=1580 RepID=UPI003EBC8753
MFKEAVSVKRSSQLSITTDKKQAARAMMQVPQTSDSTGLAVTVLGLLLLITALVIKKKG